MRSYEQLLRVHVIPQFGKQKLTEIRRDIKQFLAELGQATRLIDETPVPKYSRNTLRLIVCALRTVLNAAIEDRLIESNPAAKIGKFAKSEKPAHEATAITREEAEKFLWAVEAVCPDWYLFFLTALRAGPRNGELIALRWGDIAFGEGLDDPNRYIYVQRNYSHGRFMTPKRKNRAASISQSTCEIHCSV